MISASIKSVRKVDTTKAMARINAKFLESASVILQGAARRNTPVDTGRLRSSISRDVQKDEATVGTNVNYAQFVEYGTKRMKAQPFMRPAVDKNRKNLIKLYRDIYRQVFSG